MTIQNKDYQNHRKTHIFFGVEDEWGTHPKPPESNREASVERGINYCRSTLTQSPEHASVGALVPCVSSLSRLVADPMPLLNC